MVIKQIFFNNSKIIFTFYYGLDIFPCLFFAYSKFCDLRFISSFIVFVANMLIFWLDMINILYIFEFLYKLFIHEIITFLEVLPHSFGMSDFEILLKSSPLKNGLNFSLRLIVMIVKFCFLCIYLFAQFRKFPKNTRFA